MWWENGIHEASAPNIIDGCISECVYFLSFSSDKLFAIIIGLVGVLFIFGIDTIAALFTKNYFVFLQKLTGKMVWLL